MISTERMYVARPAAANGAAILIFQEAFGVNGHIRDVAQRFANHGFLALAPELFHRTAEPGFEASYDNFDVIRPHMAALTPETIIEDARGAYEFAATQPAIDRDRVACIGFCMGGRVSYLANSALNLRAAISFYGGGIAPDLLNRANDQHGPMLMFWGGKDSHIPPEQYRAVADALTASGKVHEQVVFSDAGHGFFNNERSSYHAAASQQAWALCGAFLESYGLVVSPSGIDGHQST
jgi:carboxymethylenebutenolidase